MITATERLGWPPRGPRWRGPWWRRPWWHALRLVERQDRLVYGDRPGTPTATCHLQVADDQPALCGYPWEILVAVPGNPPLDTLPQWLRCDECTRTNLA